MKRKRLFWLLFWLVVVILIIFVLAPILAKAANVFEWREVGRAPLMPEIKDQLSLQEKFSSHKEEILEGIRLAEPAWDSDAVFVLLETAVRGGRTEEMSFAPGQKFSWMVFRPKGKVGIVREVQWVGKENLEGFQVSVLYDGKELKFYIPKECGNLTLLEGRALPAPQAEVPSPPRVEPIPPIKLEVEPPSPIRLTLEIESPPPIILRREREEKVETRKRRWWIPVVVGAATGAVASYFIFRDRREATPPTIGPPTVITK